MGQRDRLKSLADDELLAGLSNIVRRRNRITAEFLEYLAELDERRLFLDLGYSSLFEYCVVALGLCESTAGRHIAAARVGRDHPEVFALVASGELHASALSLMRKHASCETAAELFEMCRRKTARQVEALLAARFPRPDVPDSMRRLPVRSMATLDVESSTVHARGQVPQREAPLAASTDGPPLAASNDGQRLGEKPAPEAAKPRRLEPLSADRFGVHFTADRQFRELLERVRGLAGHRLPNGDLMTLLKRGLEAYERELERDRFAIGRKPRAARIATTSSASTPTAKLDRGAPKPGLSEPGLSEPGLSEPGLSEPGLSEPGLSEPAPRLPELEPELEPESQSAHARSGTDPGPVVPAKRTRYTPAAVAREVFVRDGKQCSYVAPDGRRCTARRCLELDHVKPWANGGEATTLNLRVLCRGHNQQHARHCFGKSKVWAARIRAARERCSGEARRGKEPNAATRNELRR
jgi:GLTT repeat (6 copies)